MRHLRSRIHAWITVPAVILTAVLGVAISANAKTVPPIVQSHYVTQARAAGLSNAQANQLQYEVANYIHAHGGTQAALNVVDFAGGSITFTVPGEKFARNLATDPHPLATPACGSTAFCEYNGTFYGGTQEISIFRNCEYQSMPFGGEGSYINHLPNSGTARWYDITKTHQLYQTPGSPSANPQVNWLPVYFTRSC